MPAPNYAFEKRQRELVKKKKLEEKNARKREAHATTAPDTADAAAPASITTGPAVPSLPAPRIHRRS